MAVDTREALRKLQSGQALTAAEKAALGIGSAIDTSRLDAAAAANAANAANTIKALQDLGVGGAVPGANTKLAYGDVATPGAPESPTLVNATSTPTAIPPLNNRSIQPTENPGEGFEWRWISMAYANNKYGGEWRKVPKAKAGGTTGASSASTGATGPTGTNATGQTFTTSDGKTFNNYSDYITYQAKLDSEKSARQSAYDTLYAEFNKYGLGSLVEDIKGLIQDAKTSPSQFAIALQNTDAYKKRFAANQDRIAKGLRALTPAEYIGLEDQYQNIMRNYGLPASYYSKDSMGTQAGFNKFIANDVSATELEDRIATAQQRVINADVNVKNALRQFYPDITDGDILAYTLDPTNALQNIKRKVTAAEIGGAALGQGLMTSVTSAEDLAKYGITKAQAQQGYQTIGEFLPTAEKLGDIYANQGLGAYDQLTAEQEVFGTAGAAEAARKRKRLSELEKAKFGGSAGLSNNALNRDRAGAYQGAVSPGAGQF